MAQKTSVVTPERFSKGFTYADWFAQIKVNKDRFQEWYDKCQVKKEDAEALRKLVASRNGPTKVLAIAEDWCPDVIRGLPVMVRIAEASGLELKVFPRDLNLDIMSEFLNRGEFQSIPTFVFYTADHKYLGHWIERPALANKEIPEINAAIDRELAGKSDEEKRPERRKRTDSRWPVWQQESVKEILDLLSKSTR